MNIIEKMLGQHPTGRGQLDRHYGSLLLALAECVTVCTSCADACLGEPKMSGHLRNCIRVDQDCADVCTATLRVLTRKTDTPAELVHALLHASSLACQQCADICESHASMHAHCATCAAVCRHCQERCNFLLGEISSSGVADNTSLPEESTTT